MLRRGGARGGGAAAAPGVTVYQMRQQMFSIGDDYWIRTSDNRPAFKVDGKALRIRKTLVLESPTGQEIYKIKEHLVTIRDTMEIEGPQGTVATVKKALISPLRERYVVQLAAGGEWNVQGSITDHEYEVTSDAGKIAEVGKKWFRVADTYGIQVGPGQDDALVVAVAVVIDSMAHKTR